MPVHQLGASHEGMQRQQQLFGCLFSQKVSAIPSSCASTSESSDFHRSSSFVGNAMSLSPQRMSAGLSAKAARSLQIESSQSVAPTM